jgi:AAA15 family ATPase/GTPase
MIKSFIFEKFKGYERAVLWLEQVTTLIGSNASGKSNAIEGIYILSELATGRDLSVIFDGTKNSEGMIRGGARGCCRFGADSFLLGCTVDWDEKHDLLYRIRIHTAGRITVDEESLYLVKNAQLDASNATAIFKTVASEEGSGDIVVEYTNGKRGNNPQCRVLRSMSVLSQMQSRIPVDTENYQTTVEKIQKVRNALTKMFILDPVPSLMRGYSRVGDSSLRSNCSNVSSVLYAIKGSAPEEWEKFCGIIKELPENEIKDIDFVKTSINDVILVQKEQNKKRQESIDATRLSDGTLRCIAVLAAVLSEPEHSLIAIEELDNGVHPSRVIKLMDAICAIARRRKIDLIMTTHNVTVLNGLDKKGVLGVSVVYRDAQTQESKIIPFVDIRNQAGLLATGGIGDALETEKLLFAIKNTAPIKPFAF